MIQSAYQQPSVNTATGQQGIVSTILSCMDAEKIFLLGTTQNRRNTTSIFSAAQPSCLCDAHSFCLVLCNKATNPSFTALQDQIESRCSNTTPLTAIIIDTGTFCHWLVNGHPFAYIVMQKATLLHDGNNIPLPPATAVDADELQRSRQSNYLQSLNRVIEFITGAELYSTRMQYKMAAFMLHQAAEQALRSLLFVTTGLHTTTHNLDRLIRYCTLTSWKLQDIFPRNTKTDEHLFKLLQSAYIDSRYKEFTITGEELAILMAKVKALQLHFSDVCKDCLVHGGEQVLT